MISIETKELEISRELKRYDKDYDDRDFDI